MYISVRCVVTLIWLEFLGKTGISVLKATILIALMSGIQNTKTKGNFNFRLISQDP